MSETAYNTIFILFALLLGLVRWPQHLRYWKKEPSSKVSNIERWTFPLAFFGMLIIPFIHIFTGCLDSFKMNLPDWIRLSGSVVASFGLAFLWRVHKVLGSHWSPITELTKEHKLIRSGPYKYIRHPMYSAFYLLIIGTWLNMSNWFIGLGGLFAWSVFCLMRIRMEEKMMIKEFGAEYKEYMKRTGSLFPKFITQ